MQYDFYERVVNMSLNCYRQGFSIVDKGHLMTDRITDIPKSERMVSQYVSSVHCPNPSDLPGSSLRVPRAYLNNAT